MDSGHQLTSLDKALLFYKHYKPLKDRSLFTKHTFFLFEFFVQFLNINGIKIKGMFVELTY